MKIINPVTRVNPALITTVKILLTADTQLFIPKNPAMPVKNRIIATQKFIFNNEGWLKAKKNKPTHSNDKINDQKLMIRATPISLLSI